MTFEIEQGGFETCHQDFTIRFDFGHFWWVDRWVNMTGLQPVSKPVEQEMGRFNDVLRG